MKFRAKTLDCKGCLIYDFCPFEELVEKIELVMRKYLLGGAILLLAACTASGPQKALDEMANAMEKNNGAAFLSHIDMKAFAVNHIRNLAQNSGALNSINAITKMFGLGDVNDLLGGIDQIFGNVVDMQARISDELNRAVSSGELMAECRKSDTPNCPWVPESLRKARIVELGPDSAIAQVTTPTSLTSWLALRKINGQWLVTGQAVLESAAREFAAQPQQGSQPKQEQQGAQRI
ncbi:MAG: hypothetical protein HDQ91_00450 [Desulfovibrio sp.]|nr:hypothetical protein [Desulfovibrio sp.]